jgi:hypothetical protein
VCTLHAFLCVVVCSRRAVSPTWLPHRRPHLAVLSHQPLHLTVVHTEHFNALPSPLCSDEQLMSGSKGFGRRYGRSRFFYVLASIEHCPHTPDTHPTPCVMALTLVLRAPVALVPTALLGRIHNTARASWPSGANEPCAPRRTCPNMAPLFLLRSACGERSACVRAHPSPHFRVSMSSSVWATCCNTHRWMRGRLQTRPCRQHWGVRFISSQRRRCG